MPPDIMIPSLWDEEDHSSAANDRMVRSVKSRAFARKAWRTMGHKLAVQTAMDGLHGHRRSDDDELELSSIFSKKVMMNVRPKRFGELVVKVEEVNSSEARRSIWQRAGTKVKAHKSFARPVSPLQNKTDRMWSESGEVPDPAQKSAVRFDASHHRLTRRTHLALKDCALAGQSKTSDARFAAHVGELFRMRYSMRASLLPNANAYPDGVWGVHPHQFDIDRPRAPPPMDRLPPAKDDDDEDEENMPQASRRDIFGLRRKFSREEQPRKTAKKRAAGVGQRQEQGAERLGSRVPTRK